jgi:hypothetical protein
MSEHGGHGGHEITIHIDKKTYKVDQTSLTGAEIRKVADPNITDQYDLWLEVPGGQDRLIEDGDSVELKDGMHFFSVPKTINPGR